MKAKYFLAAAFAGVLLSCGAEVRQPETLPLPQQAEADVPDVIKDTELFYNFDSASSMIVSDPIIYEVVVKNHIPDDDWETERLAKTNIQPLANAIFQAVYKGRLKAYDYMSDQEIPADSVKALEKQFKRRDIGNIMFEEKWYFNENTMTMTKKVTAMTLGYELRDKKTKEFRGFKAAFKVKF